jgi:hypothetical protein
MNLSEVIANFNDKKSGTKRKLFINSLCEGFVWNDGDPEDFSRVGNFKTVKNHPKKEVSREFFLTCFFAIFKIFNLKNFRIRPGCFKSCPGRIGKGD